ncbi:MAG: dihydrofolate reductase [Bacilli bacterium]|nr:dihydrofolate reductase [Bacilli bacterium]
MAKITIIAAIGKNRELGRNNDLIWHLKEDMKFFKEKTSNHKIVMGYNTFKSLPGLLPNREHIILTHQNINDNNITRFDDFEKLKSFLNQLEEDVFVIGGGAIYSQFLDIAQELLLTEIDDTSDADVYFPKFTKAKYKKIIIKENEENGIKYRHISYRRK